VHAQLLADRIGRPAGQQRGHDAELAARLLDAVQHVREERIGRKVAVLPVHHEGQLLGLGPAQPSRVVADLSRHFPDHATRLVGQAALVLQRTRDGADGDAGGFGHIADGHGHGSFFGVVLTWKTPLLL
jgi:hypothetical protein